MALPIFVTRVNVGKGKGMVLISMESPAGDVSKGEVENLEALRIVMSLTTFAEVTRLFADVLRKMETPIRSAPMSHNGWPAANEHGVETETFAAAGVSGQKH